MNINIIKTINNEKIMITRLKNDVNGNPKYKVILVKDYNCNDFSNLVKTNKEAKKIISNSIFRATKNGLNCQYYKGDNALALEFYNLMLELKLV